MRSTVLIVALLFASNLSAQTPITVISPDGNPVTVTIPANVQASCDHQGFLFPLGLTRVNCSASFDVTVNRGGFQLSDLVYQGSFVPPYGSAPYGTQSGGGSLVYNPARDSLFVTGTLGQVTVTNPQRIAEISIPAPVKGTTFASLPVAALVQTFTDPSEGKYTLAAVPGTPTHIGGLLIASEKLVFTEFASYDGSNLQTLSHFTRPLDLSLKGQVAGPFKVAYDELKAGFFSGWMTLLPKAWQALGGTALTGQCCVTISSRTSNGPGAFAFTPDDLGVKTPVPATPLEYYPQENPLSIWNTTNPYWNGATKMGGMLVLKDRLLFFGMHGTGTYCYGNGTTDESLDGTLNANGVKYCYDPVVAPKGGHSYPYQPYVWSYALAELAGKKPWDAKPEVQVFPLPMSGGGIVGVAFDEAKQRLFLTQAGVSLARPVIHVYQVN